MKDLITTYRRANAILQKLNSSKKEWVFLVEGKSDRVFFGKFVIPEHFQISICDGNSNLQEIASILRERSFTKYLGVIDSDFDRLEDRKIADNQIFQTDFHDIEISIFESKALADVLNRYQIEEKFGKFEKDSGINFLESLYCLSEPLGYLRWANQGDKLGLAFKPKNPEGSPLKYEKFIDKRTLGYKSDEALVDYISQYSKNRNTNIKSRDEILASLLNKQKNKVDRKQLCNGHDMCYILSLALKHAIGSCNVSSKILQDNLVFAYDSEAFKMTDLYKNIKKWEKSNTVVFYD